MKRFIIGAVAAAAAFASFSTPAHATHDKVCTPPEAGPPVCISGYTHHVQNTVNGVVQQVENTVDAANQEVDDTQNAAWNAWLGVIMPVVHTIEANRTQFDKVPDPLCVGSTCVEGLREYGLFLYGMTGFVVMTPLFVAMCEATQQPCAPVPLPL